MKTIIETDNPVVNADPELALASLDEVVVLHVRKIHASSDNDDSESSEAMLAFGI